MLLLVILILVILVGVLLLLEGIVVQALAERCHSSLVSVLVALIERFIWLA